MPYVFTEQGVAMLSSVLRSEEAINDLSEDMRQEIDTIYQGSNEKVGWKVEAPPEGLALPALCR